MVREENYDVVIVGCGVGSVHRFKPAVGRPDLNDLQGRYREL